MKVLYAGIQAENYDQKRKYSFEYTNFYTTLRSIQGVEVIEYPFDTIVALGKKEWNRKLLELVQAEAPDVLFAFMYTDEFDTETLDTIKKTTSTKTVGWFADDYWRFFNYSKHWAEHLSYVVTTCPEAIDWYRKAGYSNVILSQWACNPTIYKRLDASQDINISFIGQHKPARARMVDALVKQGIAVETFGFGWQTGRLSQDALIQTIARTKINLNLNVRGGLLSPAVIGRLFLKRSRNRLVPDFHLFDNIQAYMHFPTLHTHARPFELAGAGGFVISGYSKGIERYYEEDKEMVFYHSESDLAVKIKYYLGHSQEREAIREAGYARTLKDHTYDRRLRDIFQAMGFTIM